jgi:RNA polymerase sigma-70 factor, ECF subfamily
MDATLAITSTSMDSEPLYVIDVGSFEDLYRREFPNLVAVARALTGHREASEDLVQDTMVKTFVNWRRVQHFGRLGAWCLRVLTNACTGRWRQQRTAQRYLDRQRRTEPVTPGPSVEFVGFWTAVRRLPERPRLVVTLYYAGDRSIADIASIVRVPEGTVKSDLARARTVLMVEVEQ